LAEAPTLTVIDRTTGRGPQSLAHYTGGPFMMRIQYEGIIQKLYKMIDEEFEIETEEGKKIFLALSQALFDCYISNKTEKVHIDG